MNHAFKMTLIMWLLIAFGQVVSANDTSLISNWAPIIYQQDLNQSLIKKDNVFTKVNFDGDWRTNNNSGNLLYYLPVPAMYYSLVESETHYFIGYYLYYPCFTEENEREHDMVGIMEVVRKTDSGEGNLDRLFCYHHNKWRKLDISKVVFENDRPLLAVCSNTHKIIPAKLDLPITEYRKLEPLLTSDLSIQVSTQVGHIKKSNYRLVNLQELWQHRNEIGTNSTFSRWGFFDSYFHNEAIAPWLWEYRSVNWLRKPAEFIKCFQELRGVSLQYVHNPYL